MFDIAYNQNIINRNWKKDMNTNGKEKNTNCYEYGQSLLSMSHAINM